MPWALWLQNAENVSMKIRALTLQANLKERAPTNADWSNIVRRLTSSVALEHNTKATAGSELTADMRAYSMPA